MASTLTTFAGLAAPLAEKAFDSIVAQLGVDAPSLWSLLTVETRGFGFLADRRPKILFERHVFHQRTGARYDAAAPDVSSRNRGGYAPREADEYPRLMKAMSFDAHAAFESTSWGLGQVMGFNATRLGYPSVEEMVGLFSQGEDAQLDGSRRFIAANAALAAAFRAKQWAKVAFFYNGSSYADNKYDTKLRDYHDLYTLHGTPSLEVRAAQVRLIYAGLNPKGVDGVLGPGTRVAIVAFQKANGRSVTGDLDAGTLDALSRAAGV